MTKRQEDKDFIMKPKVDFCFKELMGDSQVRRGFISAFLGIRPEEIKETQLMTTHLPREHMSDKLGILDVCVMLNGMTQIDMEIQVASFPLWPERSLFYLSKLFAGRISEGDSYAALCKCIHIGILDFVLFPQEEEYYSCYHFWEDRRRQMYTDKMEIHVLELLKLAQKNYPESDLLADQTDSKKVFERHLCGSLCGDAGGEPRYGPAALPGIGGASGLGEHQP